MTDVGVVWSKTAATVAEIYPTLGETFAGVVIGTVVLIGPFLLRSALTEVGETAPTEKLLH